MQRLTLIMLVPGLGQTLPHTNIILNKLGEQQLEKSGEIVDSNNIAFIKYMVDSKPIYI